MVGGWWLQPDCNLPSGFAMERQIGLGKAYFEGRFGAFPRIAYNVDSFGHAATLPGLMRAAGQDRYVMMRPQPAEMALPGCLFRWRGFEGGPEVVTFRIVESYNVGLDLTERRVRAAIAPLPEGVDDTMLFVGFGDHGGGPTEREIRWLRDHQHSMEGVRLVFSSPSRYFDAVWPRREALPLITGELQQHAIGCYSVCRPIKTAVRRAEHLVRQAEIFAEAEPQSVPPDAAAEIKRAWGHICFNHFHDTLGGSCLPSAYPQPLAQLGGAQAVADTLLQEGLRRRITALPDDPRQRIVLYNASDLPYEGPVEFMPWLDWQEWGAGWRLMDEGGASVPHQIIAPEALIGTMVTLLFPAKIDPRGLRVLRIESTGGPTHAPTPVAAAPEKLSVADRVDLSGAALRFGTGETLELPRLMLYDDPSDTWSHGLDRYANEPLAQAVWESRELVDRGPLMASWIRRGAVGESRLTAEWRVYGEGFAELRLTVDWRERHRLLKLVQPLAFPPARRTDGILGGWLARPCDGRELPLRDGMILEMADGGGTLGIVAPDVYAADVTAQRARLTLLRSPLMAHHEPYSGHAPRRTHSDRGGHTFRFRFLAGPHVRPALMDEIASAMQRPPVMADLTRGMPKRLFDRS